MLQHIRFKIQENTKADHMRCIRYVVCLFYISACTQHFSIIVSLGSLFYGVAFSNHTKDKKAHDRWNTLCHGLSDGSTDVGMLVGSDTYIKGIVLVMRLTVIAGL